MHITLRFHFVCFLTCAIAQQGNCENPRTLATFDAEPDSLAWSADGKTIAVGCRDKFIHLLDAESGQSIKTIRHGQFSCQFLSFSQDSTKLLSISADGSFFGTKRIDVWEVKTSRQLLPHEDSEDAKGLEVEPDDSEDDVFDPFRSLRPKAKQFPFERGSTACLSPDGNRVAASGGLIPGVVVYDLDSREASWNRDVWATSVLFAPDGSTVIALSDEITVMSSDSLRAVKSIPLNCHDPWYITAVGKTQVVACCHGEELRLVDLDSRSVSQPFARKLGTLWAVSNAPGHDFFALASGSVSIWRTNDQLQIHEVAPDSSAVRNVAFNPRVTKLATIGDEMTLRVFRVPDIAHDVKPSR